MAFVTFTKVAEMNQVSTYPASSELAVASVQINIPISPAMEYEFPHETITIARYVVSEKFGIDVKGWRVDIEW